MNRDRLLYLLEICCPKPNSSSILNGRQAKEKIIFFLKQSGTDPDMAGRVWDEPEVFLGKFSELPMRLQKALAEAAVFFDKERILENNPFLRDHILKPLWNIGNIFLSAGERIRKRNKEAKGRITKIFLILITKILFNIGTILSKGSFRLARKTINAIRFTQWYRQPFLYALWKYLKVDIQNLCYAYIERIPVDAASGAVWQCTEKSSQSTALIGLDFVPSGGKLYFIEANFNAGFGRERLLMYKDREDPIGKNLVSFAVGKKYKNIHIYGHNESTYFNAETEQSWRNTAKKNHIHLEVIDDIFSPSLCFSRKKRMVPMLTEQTLNVLVRAPANAVLSKLIAQKGNLEDCIRKINPQPEIPALPSLWGSIIPKDRETDTAKNYNCFPKMIIKHRMKDDAQGITILNSYEIPDEYKSGDYLVTEFLKADLISKSQERETYEYVYKYRSIILLTTDGPCYLGSYILRSGIPVPSHLPEGVIADISPFIANYSFGGAYENISEKQDNLCKEASLAVGNVIHSFLKQKTMSDILSGSV